MNRKLLIVLLILVCMLPLCALAANDCPNHPNAQKTVTLNGYSEFSAVKHTVGKIVECSVCHRYLGDVSGYEWHSYSGDYSSCSKCGYTRPSKSTLSNDAYARGADVVNRDLWVLYDGGLYSSPDTSSKIGSVSLNDNLIVLDYLQSNGVMWLQVRRLNSTAAIGWISAEIARVSPTPTLPPPPPNRIRITVSSGRARSDAGTEYAYIETVHFGEEYQVVDTKAASTGTIWCKIYVSGRYAWVSLGLGEMIY